MPALGEEFRSAREARGLSLSDVAERLHIRSVYLAAIEDEDWKAIGAPVYVRGFMRTYARFLGLDAEDAVARFAASGGSGPAVTPAQIEERDRDRGGERTSPSAFAIGAVIVAIAVVLYVAYSYVQYRSGPPVPVAVASPGDAAVAPVAEDSAPPVLPTTTPLPAAVRAAAVRGLHLSLTQTSWLRVAIDGTVVAEGTFPAGTAKAFRGKVADVRLGNAGGVTITVNGRPVGPLGKPGDVVDRRFVLSGE